MEDNITFDEKGETCLQFTDFQLYMNFCEYCADNGIPFVADTDTMRASISRQAFESLPKNFRNLFLVLDTGTSKKILERRRGATHRRRRAASIAIRPADEQKMINALLPSVLMPRSE